MTKKYNTLMLFITIISSIFLFNTNALAAEYKDFSSVSVGKVDRQEAAVIGLIDYSSQNVGGQGQNGNNQGGGAQVITSNGAVSGYTCNQFMVSYERTVPGRPYISNQGNILYRVEGTEECAGLNLTAFCLDPNLDGVYAKDGQQAYNASPIELDTKYGKRLLGLYLVAHEDGANFSDESTRFAYQSAARLLMYRDDSDYMSKRNVVKGRLNSHIDAYKDFSGGSIGPIGGQAAGLASRALTKADALENDPNAGTVGISISQVGSAKSNGSGYDVTLNVTISNYSSAIKNESLSISGASIKSQTEEVIAERKEKVYTIVVALDSIAEGECGEATVEATFTYNNPLDLRHAYIISPNAEFGLAHQNFAVFAPGGDIQVKNNFNVTTGDDCTHNDPCKPHGVLTCDATDGKIVYVNDGSLDGDDSTTSDEEWNTCIIGGKDAKNNSYDVVNTSQMIAREEDDEEDTQLSLISGITTYGEEIKESDYCQISCKEKYSFILPGYKENIPQGTYFEFHTDGNKEKHAVVGIGAERLCVSNNIQKTKFNKRVLDLRKQQVDYLNAALFYEALYNAMYSKEVMEEYKESRIPSTCTAWEDKGKGLQLSGYDKFDIEDCDGLKAKADPELSKTKILPEFKSKKTGKFKYYTIIDQGSEEENLKHFELETHEVNLDLDKSFAENIKNKFNAPVTAEWYETTYSDSVKMTEVVATVAYFQDKEATVEYKHSWCTEKEVKQNCDKCAKDEDRSKCCYNEDVCKTSSVKEEKHNGKVKYVDTTEDDNVWESLDINDHIYKKYRDMLGAIEEQYEIAVEKYEALNKQIGIQSDSMQECTNFLQTIGDTKLKYYFNPEVTFSYEEDNYMTMLKPNKLVPMDDVKYEPTYDLYFCSQPTDSANAVFGCNGEGETSTEFEFGIQDGVGPLVKAASPISSANDAIEYISIKTPEQLGKDITSYYNAARVGSRAAYGAYTSTHGACDNHSVNSDCFYFFESAKPFYTQAPDGLVTIDSSGNNKTIVDTDGKVYPVALTTKEGTYEYKLQFSNIGNYFGTTSLGRFMGSGNSLLSGKTEDALVCNYEVERLDNPPENPFCTDNNGKVHYRSECQEGWTDEECLENLCPNGNNKDPFCTDSDNIVHYRDECNASETETQCRNRLCKNNDNGNCNKIVENDCNGGAVATVEQLNDDKYKLCLEKLLRETDGGENCCDQVDDLRETRSNGNSTYHGSIPSSLYADYERLCDNKENCTGFTIIGVSSSFESYSDSALVTNDGAIQVNPRTVSLNNLFPNKERGINWELSEARAIKTEIEQIGDGIFGNTEGSAHGLDYHVVLTPQCAAAIRDYNSKESGDGSGYSNGGFNDYTLNVTDATTQPFTNVNEKGRTAVMGQKFRDVLEKNCTEKTNDIGLVIKNKPDTINDSSKVES